MTFGTERTAAEAIAAPEALRWSACPDFIGQDLSEAVADANDGAVLQAWRPQMLPSADFCARDIEEAICQWGYDGTSWYALSTFSGGEPDGNQLLDSTTFGPALRALLADELARIRTYAYEEDGSWVRVTAELRAALEASQ
jgi:hypothetical protein